MINFLIYMAVINLFTFLLYGYDKYRAVKNQWRISEKTLILFAVFGGSYGAFLGMKKFHHKTKHDKFTIGVPFILVIQTILIFLYFPKIFM